MNEWQNLTLAILLVVTAEIANEIIIVLFRVKNAATRFRIRLISLFSCFFVFLVLPLKMIELIIPSGDSLITSGNNEPYFLDGPVIWVSRLSQFASISIVLLVVAAFCFVIMLLASGRIVSVALCCEPASDSYLLNLVEEVSREMGVRVKRVVICQKKFDAFVYGYPPSLAVGRDLLDVLDEKELRIVIRHELYHVKGRDTLLKPLFTALCIVFLYNPMVWFLYMKLFNDRECCADRRALASSQDTRTFLSLLLKFHDLRSENLHSLAVHWMGATNRIDSLFSTERTRKIPVLVCLLFTFTSLFVGGTQLFEDHYLEIGSSSSPIYSEAAFEANSNFSGYFPDIPLIEWYERKSEPQKVRIPLQEADLVELLKASEFSEGGVTITIRVAALPIGRRRQLFGGDDIDFDANSHLVIEPDGEGKLFVSVEKTLRQEGSHTSNMYSQYSYNPRSLFTRI